MLLLDEQIINTFTEYMFVKDHVLKADATIVLGNTLWQRPLQRAIQIYNLGMSGKLVLCGGFNPKLADYEALAMQRQCLALGLAEEMLLVDDRSTNTRENMHAAMEVLQRSGQYQPTMSINLISINYHMRRALETFRDVFGDQASVGIVNYPSKYCEPNGWFKDPQGAKLIFGEALKIKTYLPRVALPEMVCNVIDALVISV